MSARGRLMMSDIPMKTVESQAENASRGPAFVLQHGCREADNSRCGGASKRSQDPSRQGDHHLPAPGPTYGGRPIAIGGRRSGKGAGLGWPFNVDGPAAVLVAALALAACTTPAKPTIQYQQVLVPISSKCVPPETPQAPKIHSDAELRALPGPERYLAIASDRLDLLAWEITVSPVLRACG
jgi:hypothetical protein